MDRSMVGKRLVAIAAGLLSIVFFCGTALGFLGETSRVSVDSAGTEGIGDSHSSSISADGRFVAFVSAATNLVAVDNNGTSDVFVHDRQTGTTTRVSVDSVGAQGNGGSYYPSISADGRFVAFESAATNLVTGDTNGAYDVFVHDLQTGTTTGVSVDSAGTQGNDGSYTPSISADGRFVAFESAATNLVAGDTNGAWDAFVYDRQTGTTTRVSVDSEGNEGNNFSGSPSISADGLFVAFVSAATNLVTGDTNGADDVFVHDLQTGTTTRVSVDSAGIQGIGNCEWPSISADGRFVAFDSAATNLVAGDTEGAWDAFVHDRQTGQTTRVSVDSAGIQGNGNSGITSISGDGRFVTFYSEATNLVAGDTNGAGDVFVHDRQTGQMTRVSVDSAGNEGNGASNYSSKISADGRFVAFGSNATNLVAADTNGTSDVFVHDRHPTTTRVSVDSSGAQGDGLSYRPSISADGRFVAFESYATNLVPGDTNDTLDAFVHDRLTGETSRVSVDSSGSQGDYDSYHPSISANGRFVAFNSDATNLVAGDTNGARDVFVRELAVVPACTDTDGDGICDSVDNSPNDFNKFQVDTDRDGVGDSADNCPNDPNPGQSPSDPCTTKNSGTAAIIDPVPVYKEGDPVLVRMCFTFTDTLLFHFVPDCYNAVAKLVDTTDPANPHTVHGRCLAGPPYTVNPYPDGDLVPVTGATECIVCDLAKWYPPEVTSVTPGSIRTYQLTGMYQNFVTDYEIDPKIWTQTGDINQACSNEDPLVGCTANVLVGKVAAPPSTIRLENTTDTLVRIEIKPGSPSPKPINLGASVIPVAILGSSTFDVSKVNATSILLQNRGAKVKGNGKPMVSTNDVNRDGYPDLVVQIDAEGIVLSSDVDYAVVTGTYTVGGQLHVFKGYDYIRIVP